MSDPTTTPTPTNEQQGVREEWAERLLCAAGGVDFPWLTEEGYSVWHEQSGAVQEHYRRLLRIALSAGLQIPPAAAVSAAAPDERAVATVARAVLATPADWPGPDREQEWAEHIARAALAAAHAETERLRKVSAAQPYETERELAVAYDEATAMRVTAEAERDEARAALAALREQYRDLATYRTTHANLGLCPEGPDDPARDPDCPVCAALDAAPSETEEHEREVAASIKELAEGEWTIRPSEAEEGPDD